MAVNNNSYYKPEEALHDLMIQQTLLDCAVDIQVLLRILVDKEIITRDEVNLYRQEVRNSPKYRPVLEEIQQQRELFQAAKDNPQEYLQALLKAKMDGKIK